MTGTTTNGVRGYRRLTLVSPFTKAVADRLMLAVIAGLGVGAMTLLMGPMYLSLADSIAEMMEAIPDSIMAIAGGADMTTASGWYTGEIYSIVAPFAVIFVAISSTSKAFGGEMENKTIGLVVANPIARTRLAIDKVMATVIHVSVAAAFIGLGTWLGGAVSGLDLVTSNIVAITLMMGLLACAVGGIALVISIVTGRGTVALLIAALVAFLAYAWSSFLPMAESVAELAWLSPWHHYIATDPLGSGMDWASAALLATIAVVLMVLGVALFKRKDIAG